MVTIMKSAIRAGETVDNANDAADDPRVSPSRQAFLRRRAYARCVRAIADHVQLTLPRWPWRGVKPRRRRRVESQPPSHDTAATHHPMAPGWVAVGRGVRGDAASRHVARRVPDRATVRGRAVGRALQPRPPASRPGGPRRVGADSGVGGCWPKALGQPPPPYAPRFSPRAAFLAHLAAPAPRQHPTLTP